MISKYNVIIPAAGSGRRFDKDANKLLVDMINENVKVIEKTINVFLVDNKCQRIVIGCNSQVWEFIEKSYTKYLDKRIFLTQGGANRCETVFNCLDRLDETEIVLVHDGARCFLRQDLIDNLISEYLQAKCDGVLPALRLTDALKKVNNNNTIVASVNREDFVLVQTPQLFGKELLVNSYYNLQKLINNKKIEISNIHDDSHVVELYNQDANIRYINGDQENKKITFPDDILWK